MVQVRAGQTEAADGPVEAGRQIRLNAFEMNAVGHIAHGLWRHPRDRATSYTDIGWWQDLARILERGLFDGLFLADVSGIYDVYKGGPETAIAHAMQVPVNDPAMLVPAMAAVTRHLGFGITANLSQEPPYLFARRMSTLDHLTRGRIAWNIVTGFLDSAARGAGQGAQMDHDARYDRADEYMDLVYKLWEASWDDDAVVSDRAAGIYARPDRVRAIHHHGRFFDLDAIHLSEPSPQRTPVLFQAGASARGLAFAATHAECIFIPTTGRGSAAALTARIRAGVAAAGRRPRDVKILASLMTVIGRTAVEAREKFEDYGRYAAAEAGLAQLAAATGIDFARFAPDEPIVVAGEAGNGIRSLVAQLGAGDDGPPTVNRLLAGMTLGGRFKPVVGTSEQVADEIAAWIAEADIDGFNLIRTVTPDCFTDVADLLVPVLQERGLYKHGYGDGTLRDRLFGQGPRPAPGHPAAALRQPETPSSPAAEDRP
ncbi:N5,N10-methylene tetrahydromethanopterin reductase [Tistrella bauzanensis]|uniref:N5,N10-methylene tetrahydromethanopterin reductase n=1 Tax=Tistrella bauzanensis TaxID=657419 RepID=A0ABQ1IAB0_9PROT|nr:LLM class flavin-dependent oxidoreductase [Tistrella bauzanensis]GGB28284.1 N5,N10-methylene tetrahydromethanopterin reductase [Tistrella bauzanensis]